MELPPRRSNFLDLGSVLLTSGVIVLILALAVGWALSSNYDDLGNLVRVISLLKTQSIYPVSNTKLVESAIGGMVDSLNDPYSVYLTPQNFTQLQQQIRGSFGGLGVVVGLKNGYLTVIKTYKDTPASEAGLLAGDVLLKINGRSTQGMDLDTAAASLRGQEGTSVALSVARGGPEGQEATLHLTRQEINVPTVEGKMIGNTGIGYIVLTQFTERTPDEMKAVLASLASQGVKGIILDLRDNPGGELLSVVNVARFFVPRGPIVYIQSRYKQDVIRQTQPRPIKVPLVVLVNGNTASAAEILAGAIKDTGVGMLVGTRTFGKGVVQTVYPLSDGSGLKLTTARYLTPGKHYIQHKGIEPDVVVPMPEHSSVDWQFDRAFKILLQELKKAA